MKLGIGDVSISEDDMDKFIAITNLRDTSIRANAGNAITMWTRKMWPEYETMISRLAKKYGLTTDEVFWRARRGIAIDAPNDNPAVQDLRQWLSERGIKIEVVDDLPAQERPTDQK